MVSNEQVVIAWQEGRKAKAGSLSTDGDSLYSYNLLIGRGREYYDYTAHPKALGFHSKTTSRHVGLARQELLSRGMVEYMDDGIKIHSYDNYTPNHRIEDR
jgi:hypothetical protein